MNLLTSHLPLRISFQGPPNPANQAILCFRRLFVPTETYLSLHLYRKSLPGNLRADSFQIMPQRQITPLPKPRRALMSNPR